MSLLYVIPVRSCDVRYGAQRMWGAAGYGFAVLISGIVYDYTGGGYESVVGVFVVALAVALAAALLVPVGAIDKPTDDKREGETGCVKIALVVEFWRGTIRPVLICCVSCCCVGTCETARNSPLLGWILSEF